MSIQLTEFDQFVQKVILHNKLVAPATLNQVKTYLGVNPDDTLLDILLKSELLKPRHADIIRSRYEQHVNEQKAQKSPVSESGTMRSEKPGVESVTRQGGLSQPALRTILYEARKVGASDLHIVPKQPPLVRLHGRLRRLGKTVLSAEQTKEILFNALSNELQERLLKDQALDTCLDIPGQGRYRSCFVHQDEGWDGSFRVIRQNTPTLSELGMPEAAQRLTEYNQGLVLVTGPGGGGKSTTLAAMVEMVNQNRNEHIITLEDPIEYVFHPKKSHISQRQVHSHTKSFAAALRAALREDPDVILIGELRDIDTASLAITAAETGHLVFATLHTNSASQTIMRLLDFFPPDQQNQIRAMVSESIRGVICQRLIPNVKGDGRVLGLEVMFNNSAIANLIREDKLYQIPNMIRIKHNEGMILMEESIEILLKQKKIDPSEAHFAVVEQKLFQEQG